MPIPVPVNVDRPKTDTIAGSDTRREEGQRRVDIRRVDERLECCGFGTVAEPDGNTVLRKNAAAMSGVARRYGRQAMYHRGKTTRSRS